MHAFSEIGSGKDAIVYQSPDPSVVLKKGSAFSIKQEEYSFGVLANLCLPNNTPRNFEFYTHEDGDRIISMQKIEGPTGAFIHHDVDSVTRVLFLYYSLMKNNIFQNDLKASNCIFNHGMNGMNGIYLIDFGIATASSEDSDCDHMVSMASLFIQSILFPVDGSTNWFSQQSSISLRTRFVNWIIGGTTRWLRKLFDNPFIKLHVNLENIRIDVAKILSYVHSYNNGRVISALPPAISRRKATLCRRFDLQDSAKPSGISRGVKLF